MRDTPPDDDPGYWDAQEAAETAWRNREEPAVEDDEAERVEAERVEEWRDEDREWRK